MPEISIITALHNCADLTRAYVDSLFAHPPNIDWELILIDDASSDSTHELLKSLQSHPRIRILCNEQNLGFAASNNRGAAAATSPILAFLNNDLLLTKDWLAPMLQALEHCDSAGIVGNVQINPRTGLIDHAGVFFGLDGMPRQARKNRKSPPKTEVSEWFAVTAACMLIRAEIYQKVGGFDEVYRNGFEDIDLCVKLRQQGYRHYVCNQSRIFHCVSSAPGRHSNNDSNSQIFAQKWTPITCTWGQKDWAPEYLQRYARQWWKFNLSKWFDAFFRILKDLRKKELIYRR